MAERVGRADYVGCLVTGRFAGSLCDGATESPFPRRQGGMADLAVRRVPGAGTPRGRRLKAGGRPGLAPAPALFGTMTPLPVPSPCRPMVTRYAGDSLRDGFGRKRR